MKVQNKDQNPYLIPGAIVVAGLLMAVALYFSGGKGDLAGSNNPTQDLQEESSGEIIMFPANENDHIMGSLDAPVKIIEFSDLECPFCQQIHPTLKQIPQEYGNQVAWIYRHAPLVSLHSKAPKEAEATECVAELGGNDAFWEYVDAIFETTPANNGLNLALLPTLAEQVGVDKKAFQECLDSGKYEQEVQKDLDDAFASGLQGTPYSVVVAPNGELFPISGSQSYEAIADIVDLALENK